MRFLPERIERIHALLALGLVFLGFLSLISLWLDVPESSFGMFLGRFHPVLVHLPIGFILLACVFEVWLGKDQSREPVLCLVWALSAGAGYLAILTGTLLSSPGGYDAELLFEHRLWGTGATLLATMVFLYRSVLPVRLRPQRVGIYLSVCLVGLTTLLAGHAGGSLTHGSGYLTAYLPASLRDWVGMSGPSLDEAYGIEDIESAKIFDQLVRPVLEKNCLECHNVSKPRGDLRLDDLPGQVEAGEVQALLSPGNPGSSEIIRRIALPSFDSDCMPPSDRPRVTVGDIELIRWWIQNGASFENSVSDVPVSHRPTSVQTVLNRLRRPQSEPAVQQLEIDQRVLADIERSGVRVRQIAANSRFVEVDFLAFAGEVTADSLRVLEPIAENILWLNLAGCQLSDEAASVLASFTKISRLHLERTGLKDGALQFLGTMPELEYLNLYGTEVTDAALKSIESMAGLKKVYLWQTQVTGAGAEQLRTARPDLEVVLAQTF